MSVALLFKMAAVGILVMILGQVLKNSGKEEYSFFIGLAGLILVLSWLVPHISDLFETIENLFQLGG
ncbi:MAG: stage III sporulation protein AC [Lachnospiraceae bacterium]|nr:stage III sporulation protein AC [Lachnospiraceae bacterium]